MSYRRLIQSSTIAATIRRELHHALQPHAALRFSDGFVGAVTMADIAKAWEAVKSPWLAEINDCDKQALKLVVECHDRAKLETAPWAVGFLRGNALTPTPSARVDHVYVWFIDNDGVMRLFNQTAESWHLPRELGLVDFVFA